MKDLHFCKKQVFLNCQFLIFQMSYLMKHQKSGNSDVYLQLFILLVLCQPTIYRDLHTISKELAVPLTSVDVVVDIFNKKMKNMSKILQPLIHFQFGFSQNNDSKTKQTNKNTQPTTTKQTTIDEFLLKKTTLHNYKIHPCMEADIRTSSSSEFHC